MIVTSYSDIYKEDPELRPYQQKAKKEIFEAWDEVDNVMFQMPTGTGKTRLFTSIISDINKYSIQRREAVKILIVAHRTELIDQISEHLDGYKVAHSFIAGEKERNLRKPVLVASIQTITNRHNREVAEKLNVQFIIIDEAHHALAESYKKLWEMYPNAKRLGVTATPWRMNHQSFTDLFDKLVMSMPIKDFIKQGHLAPYKYYSLKDDSDIQKAIDGIELNSSGEYIEASMEEKMDIGHIRAQLLDSYLSLAEGKKGIIYAINRKHARHICEEYEEAGYRVVCIDSKTPSGERKDLVEKFKNNEIDIIVNVDIFSEGFDCPDIEFIQLARPTCSLVKYLQQVGRGLRITKNKNKQNCIILDNVGMYSKFGLPDARRHWKYHFFGKNVDEEPKRLSLGGGGGGQRFVDLSEGTEDMELIQDDYEDDVPIVDIQNDSPSSIDGFFPLFGITLGKTTWQDAKDMGYKVVRAENSDSRTVNVEDVDFWDHDGEGIFTSIYWTRDESDFPASWKSKGFDWSHSFDEWMEAFKKLGYSPNVKYIKTKKYNKRDTLSAEFEALSPDGILNFTMDFNYGEHGCSTSSPETLYSITVDYEGEIDIEEPDEEYDVNEEELVGSLSAVEDFFPIFGVTLGKTTWKDAENMGAKVVIYEKGPSRLTRINNVAFWDHKGKGVFTDLHWVYHNADFPSLWKEKSFSWDLSYEDWIDLFEKLRYSITIKKEPYQKVWQGHTVLSAEFKALSPDDILEFRLDFDFGKDGYYTSSPKTLYSIDVNYYGEIEEGIFDIGVPEEYDESQQGSRCLIYNDNKTEVVGCKEDDSESIIIPEGVTSIANDAFKNNKQIKSVSFPESLINIGNSAFRGCAGITQISLNENLEIINFDAFYGTGLSEVEIPCYVKKIGASAFNCEMKVDVLNTNFEDIDGVLYDYNETRLFIYPSRKRDKHYDVEDGVQKIEYFAFEKSILQSVSLPESIKTLSTNIFNGCTNLTKLIINVEDPDEIEIDKDCFKGFDKSKCKLIVPNGCKAKYSSHPMFNDFLSIEEIKDEEEVVEIKKPHVAIDPIKLDKIFDKKSTTYKYFWFLAIISLAKEKKSLTISYKDIVIRMAAMAWPIVFDYEIDFGTGDMIPKYLNDIIKQSPLTKNIPSKVVEAYLNVYYESEGIGKILEPLLKNVPYRFLSPWIPYTTDDEIIEKSNSGDYACLYALCDDHLILNEEWWEYIKKHYSSICSSAERSFITYLKQKSKHNNFTKFMAVGWSMV